jgi:hypothetical protein
MDELKKLRKSEKLNKSEKSNNGQIRDGQVREVGQAGKVRERKIGQTYK